MSVVYSYRKSQTVEKTRNARPINVAHSLIPVGKNGNDKTIKNVLFHKNLSGHILIGLNNLNEPVTAWRDIDAIVPIKSTLVIDSSKFKQIVSNLNPTRVYLNDGVLLGPLKHCSLMVYSNKTLLQILADIKIERQTDIKKDNNIPTYKDMQILEPHITRREYNKFCKSLLTPM